MKKSDWAIFRCSETHCLHRSSCSCNHPIFCTKDDWGKEIPSYFENFPEFCPLEEIKTMEVKGD